MHVTEWLSLDAGRFYTPFGIERFTWYSPTNQLVTRPLAMREIVPGNFYATGIKASGLLHSDDVPRFTYELALTNGLGEHAAENRRASRQTRDNNSSSALSGRASFVLWPWLELGASYHEGAYDNDGNLDIRFLGADLSGRWRGWEVRSELVTARADRLIDGLAAPALEQRGWYTQLSYTLLWDRAFLPGLSIVSRYDRIDLDRSLVGNDDQQQWALGANLKLYEHFRFKAEVLRVFEKGPPKRNNAFFSQLVVDF